MIVKYAWIASSAGNIHGRNTGNSAHPGKDQYDFFHRNIYCPDDRRKVMKKKYFQHSSDDTPMAGEIKDFKDHLTVIDTSNLVDKVEMKLVGIFVSWDLKNGDAGKFRATMRAHPENHFQRIADREFN